MSKTKVTAQSTTDLWPKHQTSEISIKTSHLMLKHQKWQHWPKLYRWANRSRHIHNNFCDIRRYLLKGLLWAHLCRKRCIESTADAFMRQSLHLKRRGYVLHYHFSDLTWWTIFLVPFCHKKRWQRFPKKLLIWKLAFENRPYVRKTAPKAFLKVHQKEQWW